MVFLILSMRWGSPGNVLYPRLLRSSRCGIARISSQADPYEPALPTSLDSPASCSVDHLQQNPASFPLLSCPGSIQCLMPASPLVYYSVLPALTALTADTIHLLPHTPAILWHPKHFLVSKIRLHYLCMALLFVPSQEKMKVLAQGPGLVHTWEPSLLRSWNSVSIWWLSTESSSKVHPAFFTFIISLLLDS